MATVEYVPAEELLEIGMYDGSAIMMLGHYRVDLGDFVYLSPHTGFIGTVSAEPIDDPEFASFLISTAEDLRAAHPGG